MYPASLADAGSAARRTPPPKSRYTIPGDNDIAPAAARYDVVAIARDQRVIAGDPPQIHTVVAVPRHNLEVSIVEEKSGRMPVDLDHRITASRSGPVVDDTDGSFGADGLGIRGAAPDLR